MKKTMLILGIASLGIFGAFQLKANNTTQTNELETGACNYGQCIKIKKDGWQCKNCSQQYSSYCWSHK